MSQTVHYPRGIYRQLIYKDKLYIILTVGLLRSIGHEILSGRETSLGTRVTFSSLVVGGVLNSKYETPILRDLIRTLFSVGVSVPLSGSLSGCPWFGVPASVSVHLPSSNLSPGYVLSLSL